MANGSRACTAHNCLDDNDDIFGMTSSGFGGPLGAGVTCLLVVTPFGDSVSGKDGIMVASPGMISAVLEPSTYLILILGLASIGCPQSRDLQD